MTIKQIAAKYGVTYNIAYQGTYGIKPECGDYREREYPEKPVVKNIVTILEDRIRRHKTKAGELEEILTRVKRAD
ncbi:MAG: hypothetical protein J6Q65_06930 [Lentisphaeria bacterium]|nr:hypothetical protein [Lentisphaeria bacterium]